MPGEQKNSDLIECRHITHSSLSFLLLALVRQELGFGNIDRTLLLLETAIRNGNDSSYPNNMMYVPSLLPAGSLSLKGGPVHCYDSPPEGTRRRHMPTKPPTQGLPTGFVPILDQTLRELL